RAPLSLQDRVAGLRTRMAAAACAEGRAGQRVAHCFLDALTTRLHGTGALRLYNAAFSQRVGRACDVMGHGRFGAHAHVVGVPCLSFPGGAAEVNGVQEVQKARGVCSSYPSPAQQGKTTLLSPHHSLPTRSHIRPFASPTTTCSSHLPALSLSPCALPPARTCSSQSRHVYFTTTPQPFVPCPTTFPPGLLSLFPFASQDMLQSRQVYFTTTPFIPFLYATAYSAILQTFSRSSRPSPPTGTTTTARYPAFDPCAPHDTPVCSPVTTHPSAPGTSSSSSSSHCSDGSGEFSCSGEAAAAAGVGRAACEAGAKSQREGMRRGALHIVDFGVYLGGQWSLLLRRLACLPGGPPRCVRITTVDNCLRVSRAAKHCTQRCTAGAAAEAGAGAGEAAGCGADGVGGRGVGDVQVEEVGNAEQCWVAECERQKHEELGRMLTAQLTAEAAALGIERFEHRVVTMNKDNLADSLSQVEGRRTWQGRGGSGTRRMRGGVQEGGLEEWQGEGCEEEEEEEKEVVAVCCCLELQYFHDSSVMRSSPRDAVLKVRCLLPAFSGCITACVGQRAVAPHDARNAWVASLAPDIFAFMETDLSANGPFFLSRLRNCLDYHAALFECHEGLSACPAPNHAPQPTKLHQQRNQQPQQQQHHLSTDAQPFAQGAVGSADTSWSQVCMSSLSQATEKPTPPTPAPSPLLEAPTRRDHILAFERAFFGYNIVNMVATEGMQRSVRPESLVEWAQRIRHAGFVPLAVPADVLEEAYGTIRSTPLGLGMLATEGAAQLTWHGCPLLMCTLWQVPWVMGQQARCPRHDLAGGMMMMMHEQAGSSKWPGAWLGGGRARERVGPAWARHGRLGGDGGRLTCGRGGGGGVQEAHGEESGSKRRAVQAREVALGAHSRAGSMPGAHLRNIQLSTHCCSSYCGICLSS
ncbi:unnamed protein product, partial [Closterium sp. Naga37s-1]